jgi:hypothetical protein
VEGVASAGVLDVSRADGILANTTAPSVCITSDLPIIPPESGATLSGALESRTDPAEGFYSSRRAAMGSSRAARRAGK